MPVLSVALRLAVGSVVYPILRILGAAPWLNPLYIKRHSRNIYFSNDKVGSLRGCVETHVAHTNIRGSHYPLRGPRRRRLCWGTSRCGPSIKA